VEESALQESRLFKILYYLLEKGRATAPELAEKFEVSVRTVYRDIDALSGAGIPVYTESGRRGGIYLMNHFILDRAVLSDGEKMEILSALQTAGAAGIADGKTALEKLSGLFRIRPENWYEVDFSRWGSQTGDNEKFEMLKTAVISHKRVEILYVGTNREKKKRRVEPLKLLYKSRAWYLRAWCTEKEAFRLFKLNRILEWRLLDETFHPEIYTETEAGPQHTGIPDRDDAQKTDLWSVSDRASSCNAEPPQVILTFSADAAYRVYDEFDESNIEELPDGRLRTAAPMPDDEWLVAFLLSFGCHVEVEEPAYLKAVLADRAMKIYRMNAADGRELPGTAT